MRPLEVLASLAPWVAACGGAPPSGLDLTSLPSLDPAVRELLEERASAVRAAPDDGRKHGELGLALEANELWSQAEASYAAAARAEPLEPHWDFHRALALLALGRHAEAMELLRTSARRLKDAPYVFQRWGEAALTNGDVETAAQAFERTVALAPELPEGYTGLGTVELARGRSAAAVRLLERAVGLDPSYKTAHYRLGLAYRAAGRTPEAERELAAGLGGDVRYLSDPFADELRKCAVSPSARLHFALVLLESGRDERAAKVLEGLYKRQPKDVVVLNNLAIALQRLGEFQRAAELLDGALAVDPKVLSTWINLANLALAQHTSARALECSERALALAPESAKANLVHGRVLQYQNRHAEAITAFERARTADPREFDALELLASSWKALGEPARAKASLAALAEERPFDARAHLALARACLELGQRVQAEHEFATARSLAPQDPEVAVLGRDLAASVR